MKKAVTRDCYNSTPTIQLARCNQFPSCKTFLPKHCFESFTFGQIQWSAYYLKCMEITMVCSVCELHFIGNAAFIEDRQHLRIQISKCLHIISLQLCFALQCCLFRTHPGINLLIEKCSCALFHVDRYVNLLTQNKPCLWKITNKLLNMTPSSFRLSCFKFSHLAVENIERPATPGFWVDQKQYRLLSTCFRIKVRFQLLLPSIFRTH